MPPDTERLYEFARLLRARFEARATGGAVNLSGQLDLTHFRLDGQGTGAIALAGDGEPLTAIRGDGGGSVVRPSDVPMGLLGELIDLFNERFGAELSDADAIRPLLHVADKVAEQNPHFRDQAQSNERDDFASGKTGAVINAMLSVGGVSDTVLKQSLDDDEALDR